MSTAPEDGPIDLHWMGRENCIAAWRYGENLIDCGPRTTLPTLIAAIGAWRPRRLILTHIHFDHAGAAGALVQMWPNLEIWVHRRGARHLQSPERLEASARAVFGDGFDERFGALEPIPGQNIHPLDGGETVGGLLCAPTPGHASHHLSFLDPDGTAFVGDLAGVRILPGAPVLLPAPPPDIDIGQWRASVDLVKGWKPAELVMTHFGTVAAPEPHMAHVEEELARHAGLIESGADLASYQATVRRYLVAEGVDGLLDAYETIVPLDQNYVGLSRWLSRREEAKRSAGS